MHVSYATWRWRLTNAVPRTRTQETDNVGNGPIRKLRRSATSGPEDEPLSKRSRWVDDEDSEELVGLEKWIADGGEA